MEIGTPCSLIEINSENLSEISQSNNRKKKKLDYSLPIVYKNISRVKK